MIRHIAARTRGLVGTFGQDKVRLFCLSVKQNSELLVQSERPKNEHLFHTSATDNAKDKNKKKEAKKGTTKVTVNEEFLKSAIDLKGMQKSMDKTLEAMKTSFIKNLSLRSTTGAIETLPITVDGSEHELQELGQIVRKNPKTIVVNMIAFPQTIPAVLTALQKSGMNLSPQQDGTTIFIPVPKVTKEHRENLSKNAKVLYLKCRDGIRAVQMEQVKKAKKITTISADDVHAVQNQITAIGDQYIAQAEKILEVKQLELSTGNE